VKNLKGKFDYGVISKAQKASTAKDIHKSGREGPLFRPNKDGTPPLLRRTRFGTGGKKLKMMGGSEEKEGR